MTFHAAGLALVVAFAISGCVTGGPKDPALPPAPAGPFFAQPIKVSDEKAQREKSLAINPLKS